MTPIELCASATGTQLYIFPDHQIGGRYTLVQPDGSPGTKAGDILSVRVLGGGGFGTVVRSQDRLGLDRVVKLVRVDSASVETQSQDSSTLTSRLANEVRHTTSQPYKHVVPIMDYGTVRDIRSREFVYYVSPYIPGRHFDQYLAGKLETAKTPQERADLHDTLLQLVDQILAGLVELHESGVSHLDIKPANTMVMPPPALGNTTTSGARAFIIDLGAAVSKATHESHPRVTLICTEYFFPVHLLPRELDQDSNTVDSSHLWALGATIDLYCVGRMLEAAVLDRVARQARGSDKLSGEKLNAEAGKESAWRFVLGQDFKVFERFVDRLLDTKSGFSSAMEAQAQFATLSRYSSKSVLSSRLLTDQEGSLRINVGGDMVDIATPLDRVVNHPSFQRLRKLNQLAMLSRIYPEATHTRFVHSLRTFDLTKRYVRSLNRDSTFRGECMQRDVDMILASALLHDVGQYPFSHSIEDLRKLGNLWNVTDLTAIQHDQEMAAEVLHRNDSRGTSIADLVAEMGTVDDLCYMFAKTPRSEGVRPALNIGRDLISGVIDVDRVSYLLHDTARTGVPYARGVDPVQLGEALCVYSKDGSCSLGIAEGGVSAVESVLTAVYWMYRNVYWHPVNRGFMAAVKEVFWRLLEAKAITFPQYFEATYGRTDLEALTWLHDRFSQWNESHDSRCVSPLRSLHETGQFGYSRVYSLGRSADGDPALYDLLTEKASPTRVRDLVAAVEMSLSTNLSVRPCEVLLDIPLKKRLIPRQSQNALMTAAEAGVPHALMVRTNRRYDRRHPEWSELAYCSPLAAALAEIEDHSGRKVRVFFANELIRRMPDTSDLHHTVAEVLAEVTSDW